jgi:hypothetical protein
MSERSLASVMSSRARGKVMGEERADAALISAAALAAAGLAVGLRALRRRA